ncbi:MAG: DNA replication/repair protein RecF, partial [[Ruminococcus] torques]
MHIKSLSTENFRNLYPQEIVFDSGVNIFTGMNAQGKTNIIEALWLYSSCKSFRTTNEKDFINNEKVFAETDILFEKGGRIQSGQMKYHTAKRRELYLNEIKVKPSEMIGNFTSVLFFPEHLDLLKAGPEGRRKFIDLAICQVKPKYYAYLSEYNKTLFQRNNVLKSEDKSELETIEIWDVKLSKLGAFIYLTRRNYIALLAGYAKTVIDEMSGGKEKLGLFYQSECDGCEKLAEAEELLIGKMLNSREKDIKCGFTNVGVHRDDLEITLNGLSAKFFGSQGQQRSCVMAL